MELLWAPMLLFAPYRLEILHSKFFSKCIGTLKVRESGGERPLNSAFLSCTWQGTLFSQTTTDVWGKHCCLKAISAPRHPARGGSAQTEAPCGVRFDEGQWGTSTRGGVGVGDRGGAASSSHRALRLCFKRLLCCLLFMTMIQKDSLSACGTS